MTEVLIYLLGCCLAMLLAIRMIAEDEGYDGVWDMKIVVVVLGCLSWIGMTFILLVGLMSQCETWWNSGRSDWLRLFGENLGKGVKSLLLSEIKLEKK